MTVAGSNYLTETIFFIRNYLRNNIVDPISGSRPSGENFIMTSYPDKPVTYPLITIKKSSPPTITKLGEQSNTGEATIRAEIRVWARNEPERDNLTQQIGYKLTTNQFPNSTSGTSLSACLYDFEAEGGADVDETGKQGIKSSITNIKYKTFVL